MNLHFSSLNSRGAATSRSFGQLIFWMSGIIWLSVVITFASGRKVVSEALQSATSPTIAGDGSVGCLDATGFFGEGLGRDGVKGVLPFFDIFAFVAVLFMTAAAYDGFIVLVDGCGVSTFIGWEAFSAVRAETFAASGFCWAGRCAGLGATALEGWVGTSPSSRTATWGNLCNLPYAGPIWTVPQVE
ncbi:hypothetical protein Trydic_g9842 [Trypoxylus dichotomus]